MPITTHSSFHPTFCCEPSLPPPKFSVPRRSQSPPTPTTPLRMAAAAACILVLRHRVLMTRWVGDGHGHRICIGNLLQFGHLPPPRRRLTLHPPLRDRPPMKMPSCRPKRAILPQGILRLGSGSPISRHSSPPSRVRLLVACRPHGGSLLHQTPPLHLTESTHQTALLNLTPPHPDRSHPGQSHPASQQRRCVRT